MGFIDLDQIPAVERIPGIHMKTPHGQRIMLSYLQMDAGAEVPLHAHPHEQGGMVIEGRMQLTIGDETRELVAGDLYLIPGDVAHRAIALGGPVRVLDIFSPIREDYVADPPPPPRVDVSGP